ncbi:MAG: hypothetical protein AB7O26_00600 [Planctomycetaceae bacterium]
MMEDDASNRDFDTDDELDDESYGDFDDDMTAECPHCGHAYFDDADQCPHCGTWIHGETRPVSSRSSTFILLGFVAAVLAVVLLLLRG